MGICYTHSRMPYNDEQLLITRDCFICENSISSNKTSKIRHRVEDNPSSATIWTTTGSPGSIYEAAGYCEKLEIAICDLCLARRRHLVFKVIEEPKILEEEKLQPRQVLALSKW